MRKATTRKRRQDLLPEYDFRGGVRGKYAGRYAEGTNIVALDPDVAALFPDAKSLNQALRILGKIAGGRGRKRAS